MTETASRESTATGEHRALSRRVTRDSLWLLAGYAVTAGSGFLFWIVAARLVPPAELGIDTAILSIVTAAAAMASSGIGNGLLVMLPLAGAGRAALIRTGLLTLLVTSAIFGALGGVLVLLFLRLPVDPIVTVATITLGAVLWSLFAVQTPALTGLGRARLTLFVNGPTNVAKLALLPVLVVTMGSSSHPAVFATLAPAAVATAVVSGWVLPRLVRTMGNAQADQPTDDQSRAALAADVARQRTRYFRYVRRDGPATGMSVGIYLALAFLVTALSGPAQGAIFALCFQFSAVLDLVAVGFGTSLAMHAAGNLESGHALARRTWAKVATIVAGVGACVIVGSPLLFMLLGKFYAASGEPVLIMLVIGCLLRTTYDVWGSMLRAEHRASTILLYNTLEAVIVIPLVIVLAKAYGAVGAAAAVLIVAVLLSIVGAFGTWGRPKKRGTT
jgi:O-antigen/teichoic acid export membrane protein